jgi:glycine/D-amino acid oxidase-like deaminating enzyme
VANLSATIDALRLDCDARTVNSLYLCGNVLDPAAMEKEAAARREIGLGVTVLSRAEIRRAFAITRDAALLSEQNLQVDPVRAAAGFLKVARSRGAEVFAPVDVAGLDRVAGRVIATTAGGPKISARFVVLATGYELPSFLPRGYHYIASTWAIATRPQPEHLWPGRPLIWEASDPYLYMRTTADGRVLCGGEDEEFSDETARDALIPAKAAVLAEKLKGLFPALDTRPEFAWAGAFGTAETGLPIIAEIPGLPDCWLTLGLGGNGMVYSQIAAEIVGAALDGKHDPDLDLYGFR